MTTTTKTAPDRATIVRFAAGHDCFDPELVATLIESQPWPGGHVGEVMLTFRRTHAYLFPPLEDTMIPTYAERTDLLRSLRTTLADASDRTKRLAEHTEHMKPTQKGGPYYLAAPERIRDYEQELIERQVVRIQAAREAAREAAAEVRTELPGWLDAARELPSDRALYLAEHDHDPGSTDALLLDIRSALRDQRLESLLRGQRPSTLAEEYAAATARGDVAMLRTIERGYRTLAAHDGTDAREVTAFQQLGAAINRAREGRVPEDLRTLAAEVDAADAAIVRSEDYRDLGDLEATRPPAVTAEARRTR